MECRKLEKFENWLNDILRLEFKPFTLNEWLLDVDEQYNATGLSIFEVKSHMTKSGHAEQYNYEVDTIFIF